MKSSKIIVGNSSFNARDRLAVMNLLNSYGYFFNENKLEEFSDLFDTSAVIELGEGSHKTTMNLSQWRKYILNLQQFFTQQQIQPRHIISATRFDSQTGDQMSGQSYLQLFTTKHNITSLVTTGIYEFTAIQQEDNWKLNRWVIKLDAWLG